MAGKTIKPGPVPGMPVTQPKKKKRPNLGSGMAEGAAQDIQNHGLRRRKAINQATGRRRRNREGS